MWTSWLERTLGAHDAAEYAERRARRPEVEAVETRTASPSPLRGGEATPGARGEGLESRLAMCC
jgi:hypothetical protein